MKLTPEQEAHLGTVADADSAYRDSKLNLERTLRQQLEAGIEKAERRRNIAAYLAHVAGVPMTRIGREGLHTTDPKTRTDAVERGREAYSIMLAPTPALSIDPAALPHEQALSIANPPKVDRFTLESQTPDPFTFGQKKEWANAGWRYPADDPHRIRYAGVWHPADGSDPLRFTFYNRASDERPEGEGWPMGTPIIEDSLWSSAIPFSELQAWVTAVLAQDTH